MKAAQGVARGPVHPVITRLTLARREQRLSQAALAHRLGVTQTALSYWEGGKRGVAFADVARWAYALGLTLIAVDPADVDDLNPELIAGGLS